MTALISHIRTWWDERPQREQRLLQVMSALIVVVLLWLVVVKPIWQWRAAAADRRAEALNEATLVSADLESLAGENRAGGDRSQQSGGLQALIQRAADAQGMAITTAMAPDGQLGVQAASVSGPTLFSVLTAIVDDNGVNLCSMGVTENVDATLNVEASFSTSPCSTNSPS